MFLKGTFNRLFKDKKKKKEHSSGDSALTLLKAVPLTEIVEKFVVPRSRLSAALYTVLELQFTLMNIINLF